MGLIYYEKLNSFSRKYLIKGNDPNPSNFITEFNDIQSEIAELLMYHEGIAFYVFGENIPLTILINMFGVNGVESLLEQGAINFLFCKPEVTYNYDDIPGILPLQSGGYYTSKAHSDPEESVALGLKWLRNPLHEKQKRRLLKRVLGSYRIPSENISQNSVQFGIDGYNNNLFSSLGLPCEKDIHDLDRSERSKLCTFANECNKLAILSEFDYYTLDSFEIAKINDLEVDALKKASKVESNTDQIFSVENLPNFKEIIRNGLISYKELPQLRTTSNSIKFRKWIDEISANVNSSEITKEYLSSIENTKGCLEKGTGKFLKTMGVYAISCMAGELVAGPIGACVGGFTGKVLEPAVDLGINLFDTYILGGILKGWNPRHYFTEDVTKLINKSKQK